MTLASAVLTYRNNDPRIKRESFVDNNLHNKCRDIAPADRTKRLTFMQNERPVAGVTVLQECQITQGPLTTICAPQPKTIVAFFSTKIQCKMKGEPTIWEPVKAKCFYWSELLSTATGTWSIPPAKEEEQSWSHKNTFWQKALRHQSQIRLKWQVASQNRQFSITTFHLMVSHNCHAEVPSLVRKPLWVIGRLARLVGGGRKTPCLAWGILGLVEAASGDMSLEDIPFKVGVSPRIGCLVMMMEVSITTRQRVSCGHTSIVLNVCKRKWRNKSGGVVWYEVSALLYHL